MLESILWGFFATIAQLHNNVGDCSLVAVAVPIQQLGVNVGEKAKEHNYIFIMVM